MQNSREEDQGVVLDISRVSYIVAFIILAVVLFILGFAFFGLASSTVLASSSSSAVPLSKAVHNSSTREEEDQGVVESYYMKRLSVQKLTVKSTQRY